MREQRSESAQMHTLEGFTAAMIVVIATFYVTGAVGITPTSSSTASKSAEAELQQVANDVLAQAHANGNLKIAVLAWNDDQNRFNGSESVYFQGSVPPNAFGETLESVFNERGVAYNVNLYHNLPNSTSVGGPDRYIYNGDPTDNAVVASQKVVLRHGDELEADGTTWALTDSDDNRSVSTYPIEGFTNDTDEYRDSMYNVVEVRVILWRQ